MKTTAMTFYALIISVFIYYIDLIVISNNCILVMQHTRTISYVVYAIT